MNLKVGGGLNDFKFNCARLHAKIFYFNPSLCIKMGSFMVIFHEVVRILAVYVRKSGQPTCSWCLHP